MYVDKNIFQCLLDILTIVNKERAAVLKQRTHFVIRHRLLTAGAVARSI